MAGRVRSRPRWTGALAAGAGVVAAIVLVGVTVFGWGAPAPSGPPALPSLSITFAANSSAEVETLLTTLRPYVEPGDAFDLVSGSPASSPLNVANLDRWAAELRSAFPGDAVYAHTAGVAHFGEVAAGVGPNVSGIYYDYEPGFEPEFTFNFSQTLAHFANVTAIAHTYGVLSIGYPTGRPVLDSSLAAYDWNYATLAGSVDRLVVQTQTYCKEGAPSYAAALEQLLGQYDGAGRTDRPNVQITIGNATTSLPNGVTAAPAYDCAAQLAPLGWHTVYLWWDLGAVGELTEFLQDIGRS